MGFHFDPLEVGEPPVPGHLRAAGEETGFRLVQLAGTPVQGWLDALAQRGARVLQYYPHDTYLVWADAAASAAVARAPFVRWQGLFHPAYKLHPDLAGRSGPIENVEVMFFADGDATPTLAALERLGAELLRHHPAQPDRAFFDAMVRIEAAALPEVARLPAVLWLGHQSPRPILDDEMSDQIVAGNHPGGVPATGYLSYLAGVGFDGAGVTWAVIDSGVDYDHPDLASRIAGGYSFPGACDPPGQPGSDCPGGGHGTHVAGIVGGDATCAGGAACTDGGGFLYGLGMAPAVGLFAMNSLSGLAWPPAGGWQEHSKRAVAGGAVGGNNSWTSGEGTPHGYQASERTHDLLVRDGDFDTAGVAEPFIEVFSAGNSGPGAMTLTAPKEAKNLIVVANSLNARAGDIDSLAESSSRGPAVDGRWVPTVAAPGTTIASARNDLGGFCSTPIAGTGNLYAFCSGTSMAAPHVSGAIVLLTQWWRGFSAGADPSPAMAKALLVNGAVDMGEADIPNAGEGWGRVDIDKVLPPGIAALYEDQTVVFDNPGDQFEIVVEVDDPAQPLKVTLAWSDAPGAPGANPALVNDLDLSVAIGAGTYLGNRFAGGWSVAGGTADVLNNLENVFLEAPGAAVATVAVTAASLPGDGVPYAGDATDQDFALVCGNCRRLAPIFGDGFDSGDTSAWSLAAP